MMHAIQNTNISANKKSTSDIDTTDFAIEYIIIADTGLSYYKLRTEMFNLNKFLDWKIDTMERYYNVRENKIVLSDTAYDEIYRGEYLERRLPSENMSLEYFRSYTKPGSTRVNNIAIVCGIYMTNKSADSILSILKTHTSHAFVQRAKMYMGCEH